MARASFRGSEACCQGLSLRHLTKGAAGNLPVAVARQSAHPRRGHAQFHGREESLSSGNRPGDSGTPGFVRVQGRGEKKWQMGSRPDVLDEPANVVRSLRWSD